MPSDAAKKRQAKKKAAAQSRGKPKSVAAAVNETESDSSTSVINGGVEKLQLSERACTGVLASHPAARDIKISNFSITFHGTEILKDTNLELNCGRRYGLIGFNGCGKSTLMTVIEKREIPIPDFIDIFHLTNEIEAGDKTAIDCVMEVDEERLRLENEAAELTQEGDDGSERLMDIFERLEELDADQAEVRAAAILHGLGFTAEMQRRATKNFSGGWRMRIALARALFVKPSLLMLDEPTNHLDLEACVWLEQELKKYKRCLILVSHSQDFLNGVCTNIIHMHKNTLKYYGGNYDSFVKTRHELEENQMKQFSREQDQIKHMKEYIARFGHGTAKLARQAQSKEKVLNKMVANGLTERVTVDRSLSFYFRDCGKLPPPVVQVQNMSFRYEKDLPYVYKNIEFGFDLDSRVALVGPNGAGKSTLLKLMDGTLSPTDGLIRRHGHLKICRYHQHLQDMLNLEMTALDFMMKAFPEIREPEDMRKGIGRYGLTGKQQVVPMNKLSDGQICRVVFAWLAFQTPHLLLLDEPTNHLDIETIDSLAEALNAFEGGMMLVSHDFRLINQVANEIWVCENRKITKWNGDIQSYKHELRKKVRKALRAYASSAPQGRKS